MGVGINGGPQGKGKNTEKKQEKNVRGPTWGRSI